MMEFKWFQCIIESGKEEFSCILLNRPLVETSIIGLFARLWNMANIRMCADGGANVLFDLQKSHDLSSPTHIVGDMDSIKPEIKNFYLSPGSQKKDEKTQIIHDSNENNTDFDKCLYLLNTRFENIYVFGAFGGGRFDQAMANIHSCFVNHGKRICLLSDCSYAFLLSPGKNVIHLNRNFDGPKCGLLPFASGNSVAGVVVKSKGLRWELRGERLFFGAKIFSSSNEITADLIEIEASHPIMFTCEFNFLF